MLLAGLAAPPSARLKGKAQGSLKDCGPGSLHRLTRTEQASLRFDSVDETRAVWKPFNCEGNCPVPFEDPVCLEGIAFDT